MWFVHLCDAAFHGVIAGTHVHEMLETPGSTAKVCCAVAYVAMTAVHVAALFLAHRHR